VQPSTGDCAQSNPLKSESKQQAPPRSLEQDPSAQQGSVAADGKTAAQKATEGALERDRQLREDFAQAKGEHAEEEKEGARSSESRDSDGSGSSTGSVSGAAVLSGIVEVRGGHVGSSQWMPRYLALHADNVLVCYTRKGGKQTNKVTLQGLRLRDSSTSCQLDFIKASGEW
jgi:hypothetical protein